MNIAPLRYRYAPLTIRLAAPALRIGTRIGPLFPPPFDRRLQSTRPRSNVLPPTAASGSRARHRRGHATASRRPCGAGALPGDPRGRRTSLRVGGGMLKPRSKHRPSWPPSNAAIAAVASGDHLILAPAKPRAPSCRRLLLLPQHQSDARGSTGPSSSSPPSEFRRLRRPCGRPMAATVRSRPPALGGPRVCCTRGGSRRGTKPSRSFVLLDPANAITPPSSRPLVYSPGQQSSPPSRAERTSASPLHVDRLGPYSARVLRRTPSSTYSCATINGGAAPVHRPRVRPTVTVRHPGGKCQCNKGINRFHVARSTPGSRRSGHPHKRATVCRCGAARSSVPLTTSSTRLRFPLKPAHRRASRQLPEHTEDRSPRR